jgi:hypothetical protein
VLPLRSHAQILSVQVIDQQGASHQVASINMEDLGRQAVTNVRRNFDVRVGTTGIQIYIDGASVINANYGAVTLPAADYELLWVGFGYKMRGRPRWPPCLDREVLVLSIPRPCEILP